MAFDFKCYLVAHKVRTVYGMVTENEKGVGLVPLYYRSGTVGIGQVFIETKERIEKWDVEVVADLKEAMEYLEQFKILRGM